MGTWRHKPQNEHASNVGPMIAHVLAKELNVPAYIYDGITVDELTDINRITGLPYMHRKGIPRWSKRNFPKRAVS